MPTLHVVITEHTTTGFERYGLIWCGGVGVGASFGCATFDLCSAYTLAHSFIAIADTAKKLAWVENNQVKLFMVKYDNTKWDKILHI